MSNFDGNQNIDAYIRARRRRRIIAIAVVLLIAAVPVGILFSSRAFEVSVAPAKAAASMLWKTKSGQLLILGSQVLLFSDEGAIVVEAPGFVPQEVGVSRTSERQRIQVELQPLPGTAVITVSAPADIDAGASADPAHRAEMPTIALPSTDFELLVGQRSFGPASSWPVAIDLEQGTHPVKIRGPRIKPVDTEIQITGYGETQHFQFPIELGNSSLNVKTAPAEARIFLDGTAVGRGTHAAALELGEHEVTVELDGYISQQKRFNARADEHIDLGLIELAPKPATLAIKSEPSGATVLVNDEFVGSTPQRVSLTALQTHQLTIRKSGHEPIKTQIRPTPGEIMERTFRLGGHIYQAEITSDLEAEVTLNGTGQGTTPANIEVREGDRIGVSREGYHPQNVVVGPLGGDRRSYAFKMMRPNDYAFFHAENEIAVGKNILLKKFPAVEIRSQPPGGATQGIAKKLTRPFYIGQREVAYEDYRAFASQPIPKGLSPKHPVANLTWAEAAKFCNWLSGQDNLQPVYEFDVLGELARVVTTSLGYRLPTEAEWEAVAGHDFSKNQAVGPFPWGHKPAIPRAYGNFAGRETEGLGWRHLRDHADNHQASAPTGSYPANVNGLYDLAGNVTEWVTDYHGPVPAAIGEPLVDPLGPAIGIDHLVKGSSYRTNTLEELALSYRTFEAARSESVGFRIAKWIY